jgi:hypothetical protein
MVVRKESQEELILGVKDNINQADPFSNPYQKKTFNSHSPSLMSIKGMLIYHVDDMFTKESLQKYLTTLLGHPIRQCLHINH